MDLTGLASWLGKPPWTMKERDTPRSPLSREDGRRSASLESYRNTSDHGQSDVPDASADDFDEATAPKPLNGYLAAPSFYIDVPRISDSEDYDYLPGHLSAKRVLNRLQDTQGSKFRVRLDSDEIQIVR